MCLGIYHSTINIDNSTSLHHQYSSNIHSPTRESTNTSGKGKGWGYRISMASPETVLYSPRSLPFAPDPDDRPMKLKFSNCLDGKRVCTVIMRTSNGKFMNSKRHERTCHHFLPASHPSVCSFNPAFTIRPLMPAPRSSPKMIKRKRVTTSWSLGESRSAVIGPGVVPRTSHRCVKCVEIEDGWNKTHGSSEPLRLLPSQSQYLDRYHRAMRPHRWPGFGLYTTVLCTLDRVSRAFRQGLGGGLSSSGQSRCLHHEHRSEHSA